MRQFEWTVSNIWPIQYISECPIHFVGLYFYAEVTVNRLSDGGLIFHSPYESAGAGAVHLAGPGNPVCIISTGRHH
jgi:hypothetical protein